MKNDIEIGKLFEQRYVLDPILQRSYEWDTDRAINLIKDICNINFNSISGGKCRYNIGDFITYKTDELDDYKEICDGQQRLTTLVLTFANILHHHPSNPKVKGGLEILLNKKTLDENGNERKVKVLALKDADNKILDKIIESGVDGLSKEEKKSHLVNVYNKITEVFTKNMDGEELNNFYESIYRNASFFERECESQEEAIKQFNNLNGGQQSISKSRNGIATLYGIYNETHHNSEIEHFLYELSNMDTNKVKDFLCLYIYYKTDEYRESKIPKKIEKLGKEDCNILNDIIKFYKTYNEHIENSNYEFMQQSSLRQIWVDLFTDKYQHMKDVNNIEKEEVYRKFEWGYISNRIESSSSQEATLYNGWIRSYNKEKDGNLTDYIVSKLKEKKIYKPVEAINEYKPNKSKGKGKDFFVRLLLVIEKQYQTIIENKEDIIHCSKPTLEHIHPQKTRKDVEYDSDDSIVNHFGNLTIIGSGANSSLGNKSYTEKREYYKNSPYFINSKHLYEEYERWTNDNVKNNEEFYFKMLKMYYRLN